MKRSDISDYAALLAALRGSYDNAIGAPTPGPPSQNVWERLHDIIGPYPFKVGLRKMEQLDDRRWIEYGTSLNYAWRTPDGNVELHKLLASRYGICLRCGSALQPWRIEGVNATGQRYIEVGIGCPRCDAGTSE